MRLQIPGIPLRPVRLVLRQLLLLLPQRLPQLRLLMLHQAVNEALGLKTLGLPALGHSYYPASGPWPSGPWPCYLLHRCTRYPAPGRALQLLPGGLAAVVHGSASRAVQDYVDLRVGANENYNHIVVTPSHRTVESLVAF